MQVRFMLILFTLILFMLVPTMLSAQDLLLEERFSTGQMQQAWRAGFNGNSMQVESFMNNPSLDGWVGKLPNHISGGNVGATHTVARFADFYYEAKVYVPVNEGVYYGLEFRVDSSGLSAGYQFVARFLPGGMLTPRLRFRVRPSDNPGMPTVIRDWEAGEIPGGIPAESGWHTFGVKAQGHRFWFYFNGELLPGSPILDFNFLEGAVGAYLWDSSSPMLNLYIDDIVVYSDIPTNISGEPTMPESPRLLAGYPHPLRGAGTIAFELPFPADVTVDLYDLRGRKLRRIVTGAHTAGRHEAPFDAAGLAEGTYLMRLTGSGSVDSRLMTIIR